MIAIETLDIGFLDLHGINDDLPRKRVTGDDAAVLAARRERMLKVFPGRALDNSLYNEPIWHFVVTAPPGTIVTKAPSSCAGLYTDPDGNLLGLMQDDPSAA